MTPRNTVDKLSYWILPPGVDRFLRDRLLVLLRMKAQMENGFCFSGIRQFRNLHQGARCFILATGPSINTQDLKWLKDEICIGVGFFALHPDAGVIKPSYHVEAALHPPFDFGTAEKCFASYRHYPPDTIVFLAHTTYRYSFINYLKKSPRQDRRTFFHINYAGYRMLTGSNYMKPSVWDITRSPFAARKVVYSAIQLAAYMGFTTIYLLGCDHDYLNDLTRVSDHHFYKDRQSGVSDVDHLSAFSTEWWFLQYYLRWKEYRLMNEYLRTKGVRVYNATNGGMLDVFPRVVFDDVRQSGAARDGVGIMVARRQG
jgi:hypothetical protein